MSRRDVRLLRDARVTLIGVGLMVGCGLGTTSEPVPNVNPDVNNDAVSAVDQYFGGGLLPVVDEWAEE